MPQKRSAAGGAGALHIFLAWRKARKVFGIIVQSKKCVIMDSKKIGLQKGNNMRKDLGIYLHIPFCVKKCQYCDFLSFPGGEEVRAQYVRKLAEEIQAFQQKEQWQVRTIFFGGGTPSLLKEEQISCLMETIREEFLVCKDAEISMECNPGTVDPAKLQAYREAGINRISFGLQSTKNEELRQLGRIHTYETFLESYEMARKCGFENLNVDLMSALPGQTVQSFRETLQAVLALKPEHISAYSLMIEEGTPFYEKYKSDLNLREAGKECHFLPSEEEERQMYYETKQIMECHGYVRYEISNYAKHGYECRHNIGYWNRTEYAGFGLGAAGLIGNVRLKNTSDMCAYMGGETEAEREQLDKKAQMEETMFLGLRMAKGICAETFAKTFGVRLESVYGEVIKRLIGEGLLKKAGSVYTLSDLGIDVSNYALAQFL